VLSQVLVVKNPDPYRQQLDLGPSRNQPLTRFQHLRRMLVFGCHNGNRQLGSPMQLLIARLGSRNLESSTQLGQDRPNNPPLLFQRVHVAQQEITPQRPNNQT
jgi:hypothetical protein